MTPVAPRKPSRSTSPLMRLWVGWARWCDAQWVRWVRWVDGIGLEPVALTIAIVCLVMGVMVLLSIGRV